MRSAFSLSFFIILSFSCLSFAQKLEPIPQSEWCATPSEKNVPTEASAECIECLAGKSVGTAKIVGEVELLNKKIQEESEEEKVEREAGAYFVLDQYREEYDWLIQTYSVLQELRKEKRKANPLEDSSVAKIKRLLEGNEVYYDKLMNLEEEETLELLEDFYALKKTKLYEVFKKKNIKELKEYLDSARSLLNSQAGVSQGVCGLDNLELYAITAYTQTLYRRLNRSLREHPAHSIEYKRYSPYIETMKKALGKLKNHQQIVFRGADLPEKIFEKYEVGGIVLEPGYVSASRREKYAKTWGRHQLHIRSKTGKYVNPLSANPGEEEVLLQPGTRFRVLEKIPKGDSWIIKLEEVVD